MLKLSLFPIIALLVLSIPSGVLAKSSWENPHSDLYSPQVPPGYVPVTTATFHHYAVANQKNQIIYRHDIKNPCIPNSWNRTGTGFGSRVKICAKADVVYTAKESAADVTLINRGFYASCLLNCRTITYKEDPTAIMTNRGHDFMFNCKDFGVSSALITCTSADVATKMELSTNSSTPSVTDKKCGGSSTGYITTGGLADVAGAFTAGTPSAGTVTSTLTNTWTAAETDNSVQLHCVASELHTGSNVVDVYSFTFGPVSLISGNTLSITDSLTAT